MKKYFQQYIKDLKASRALQLSSAALAAIAASTIATAVLKPAGLAHQFVIPITVLNIVYVIGLLGGIGFGWYQYTIHRRYQKHLAKQALIVAGAAILFPLLVNF